MGHDLSFEELSAANAARHAQGGGGGTEASWNITDWTNALCGEAGELANFAKKVRRARLTDPTLDEAKEDLAHELADIVTYADLIATKLGINLAEAVRAKFNIVSDRVGSDIKL
jgi:NTP pyrophosphatase (non-canonical NTP hydrolase)